VADYDPLFWEKLFAFVKYLDFSWFQEYCSLIRALQQTLRCINH